MWNERFAKPGYLFGTEPAQFMVDHRAYFTPDKTALAVADGEGRNSVFMAGQGLHVTAMDGSDIAVGKARALAKAADVEVDFNVADIAKWDWAAQAYFVGPEARTALFEGMKQAVKPGGHILLHGYTPKQLEYGTGGPGALENLYTEALLRAAFSDFDMVELRSYERELDEGAGHSGMSALIDMVAQKPLG